MDQKTKELISDFFNTFDVLANSLASQKLIITLNGTTSYEDTEVYGDTQFLDIYYNHGCVYTITDPNDDMNAIISFAQEWDEAGRPTPDTDSDFFEGKVNENI